MKLLVCIKATMDGCGCCASPSLDVVAYPDKKTLLKKEWQKYRPASWEFGFQMEITVAELYTATGGNFQIGFVRPLGAKPDKSTPSGKRQVWIDAYDKEYLELQREADKRRAKEMATLST